MNESRRVTPLAVSVHNALRGYFSVFTVHWTLTRIFDSVRPMFFFHVVSSWLWRLTHLVCVHYILYNGLLWRFHNSPNSDMGYRILNVRMWSFCMCLYIYIWACAKRCSARTIHFLVLNASSGLSFLWTNLTLSERLCIKEILKINLTPKVSSELVKYENLHQIRAENQQKKGGHFGCTASVVV